MTFSEEIEAALDAFWHAAYEQGRDQRDHDDEEGTAQKAEDDLRKAIAALSLALRDPTQEGYVSVIAVEKLLCEKLGIEWQAEGMSIVSLVERLSLAPQVKEREPGDGYYPDDPYKLKQLLEHRDRWIVASGNWQTFVSALDAPQVKETPAPSSHVVGDLDYCFDPEDWEFTCSWSERDQVHGYGESLMPGHPMRVCTLLKGPDKWVADVPITWDEDGEPDETEIKWFDSEEEARAALATMEGKDNG